MASSRVGEIYQIVCCYWLFEPARFQESSSLDYLWLLAVNVVVFFCYVINVYGTRLYLFCENS